MKTIASDFAILDVLGPDHKKVERALESGEIEVVIRARITREWGRYDGTSQEFQLKIENVEVQP